MDMNVNMNINEKKYDKWIGILSIALIVIVAVVFIAVIPNKHLAKGTYGATGCAPGYHQASDDYPDFCCPNGYTYYISDGRCYREDINAVAYSDNVNGDGSCAGFKVYGLTLEQCQEQFPGCTQDGNDLMAPTITDCYKYSTYGSAICETGSHMANREDYDYCCPDGYDSFKDEKCYKTDVYAQTQFSDYRGGVCYGFTIEHPTYTLDKCQELYPGCYEQNGSFVIPDINDCYRSATWNARATCGYAGTDVSTKNNEPVAVGEFAGLNTIECCTTSGDSWISSEGICYSEITTTEHMSRFDRGMFTSCPTSGNWYYNERSNDCIECLDGYIYDYETDSCIAPSACANVYTSGVISGAYAILHGNSNGILIPCCEEYNGYTYTSDGDCVTQIVIEGGVGTYKKPKTLDCFGDGYAVDSTGKICTNDHSYTLSDANIVFHNGSNTKTVTCTPTNGSNVCKISVSDVPSCPKWCEGSDFTSCIDNLESYFNVTSFASGTTSNYYCDNSSSVDPATLLFHNGSNTTTVTCTPASGSSFCKVSVSDVPSCPKWCEGSDFTSCIDDLNSYFSVQSFYSGTTSNYYCDNDTSAPEEARIGFSVGGTIMSLTCTPPDASTTCNVDASKIPICDEWCYDSGLTQCDFTSEEVKGPYNSGQKQTWYCLRGGVEVREAKIGFSVGGTVTTLTCTPEDASTTCNVDASKIPTCNTNTWCYNSNNTQCDFTSSDLVGPYNAGFEHTYYCKTGGSTVSPSTAPSTTAPPPTAPPTESPSTAKPSTASPSTTLPITSSVTPSSSVPPENPPTGGMSIIFVWTLGIIAMVYSFWYFKESRLLKNK